MSKKIFFLFMYIVSCCFTGCTGHTEKPSKAKYIFMFIGDGMGPAQVYAAESYLSSKKGELGGTGILSFTEFPYTGMITTYSANRNITCSAAAGTALATGYKTNNSMIGLTPDGKELKSFTYVLKDEGYRIGIISNGPVNHATPASFYANAKSRNDYYDISLQIPESGFDYFAGEGFRSGGENGRENIDKVIEKSGYTISYGLDEYENEKTAEKLILCQESSRKADSKDYVVKHTAEKEMTLADMVKIGVSRFSADEKPFFIMAEAGTIDWAGHHNRTMALTEKVQELSDAVKVAFGFYLQHPDETLIIVTADHETGGLSLGCGNGSNIDWKRLETAWMDAGKEDIMSDDENTDLNKASNIGWSSEKHSCIPVPVFAVGKGAENFTGWYDNTDISGKLMCGTSWKTEVIL